VFAWTRPSTDDPVAVARELVADGCALALEDSRDDVPELLAAAGLAGHCELTLDVDRLGPSLVRHLAAGSGMSVAVAGRAAPVDELADDLPDVRVVVRAEEPLAEARCRAFADRRVRLVAGRRSADLAFARCLNVLMAGDGHAGIAASRPPLIAIAGERAAWNGRTSDSWEHVVPYGVRTEEQQRLVAGGYAVRVALTARGGRS
jgi:proline dehydrogenase